MSVEDMETTEARYSEVSSIGVVRATASWTPVGGGAAGAPLPREPPQAASASAASRKDDDKTADAAVRGRSVVWRPTLHYRNRTSVDGKLNLA
jgi:hypothetical protein